MSEEELADFLFNTYVTDRITFDIYTEFGEKHIKGKINFKEGILGFGLDIIAEYKTKEELQERIDRAILDAFLMCD